MFCGPNVIIETTHSIYEVRTGEKRFRRIHEFGLPDSKFPVGRWFSYQRMTEPEVGEPVRFFWIIGQSGRMSRIGLCETSPVVRYLGDEHSAEERAAPARRHAANDG
jgi:hypothetical protein